MKFDDLDKKMRLFETQDDQTVAADVWMVVRLDGRGFTRLTKETLPLTIPFDERFRDAMWHTTAHLMQAGFRAIYGYVQSDEISILLHPKDHTYGRKLRKILSVTAGEASACFSLAMGVHAAFDSRVSQLDDAALVMDYFSWRHEDAHRNCLNAHCYWRLRSEGVAPNVAQAQIAKLTLEQKCDLLSERGICFEDLPAWQKRGTGFYWQEQVSSGVNQKTGETVSVLRRALVKDEALPLSEAYRDYLTKIIASI
ncbi:tRNA(His) guanylyltransferase Thg1 family protein [Undibacterium danionis]|uniref:tRNA(His) guanylyltransferase n=1 Tax=Undibacterium danionis TaxID=1812100 RepID=A0ABV6IJM1_9BURK